VPALMRNQRAAHVDESRVAELVPVRAAVGSAHRRSPTASLSSHTQRRGSCHGHGVVALDGRP